MVSDNGKFCRGLLIRAVNSHLGGPGLVPIETNRGRL